MVRIERLHPVASCLLIAATLGGCADQAPSTGSTAVAPAPAPAAAMTRLSTSDLRDKAQAALVANRSYAPAGDNAAEYLLALRDRGIATPADRQALAELEPFVVIAIDQSIERRDVAEATRLRALLQRANGEAPALPRTGAAIVQLQAGLAAEAKKTEAEAARLAAERKAPAPAAPDPDPMPAAVTAPVVPAPTAPRAVAASTTPVAVPIDGTPAPALAVATETPRPAEPTPAPARAQAAAASGNARRLLRDEAPVYPAEARARRLSGEVQVRVTIGPDGRVTDAHAVESRPNGTFDRAALRAASRWVFEPGDGSATATRRLVFSPPGA